MRKVLNRKDTSVEKEIDSSYALYVEALERVRGAAIDLVSWVPIEGMSLSQQLKNLEDALEDVPVLERESE